jgi:regulatory protein
MRQSYRQASPLDAAALEAVALRYVERFQTTRARLVRHLAAKLRQRGWDGEGAPDLEALAERLAARGYLDEAAYAESRARAMAARGLGDGRVKKRLRADGLADAQVAEVLAPEDALARALAFARRKRLGPFGPVPADRAEAARQVAAMVRAGHDLDTIKTLMTLQPEDLEEVQERQRK